MSVIVRVRMTMSAWAVGGHLIQRRLLPRCRKRRRFDWRLYAEGTSVRKVADNLGADARGLRRKDSTYLVEVYPVMSGKRSPDPAVIVELAYENGRWLFMNFRYPGNDDLLTVLRTLKADRESQQD